MNEEVKLFMDDAKEQMENALNHLENELAKDQSRQSESQNPERCVGRILRYADSPGSGCEYYFTRSPHDHRTALGKTDDQPHRKGNSECKSRF